MAALLVLSALIVHKDLALDRFISRAPGVARIETSIIFDGRRRYELPVFRAVALRVGTFADRSDAVSEGGFA